ncbi:hypothetical protein CLG96_03025 [Sphingomonas oleivorans]|uniref:Uncharacterized protein n=1 Tax=Sphingomonas oleivorans TaxID=1735121 RepID=A0A2T5G1W0_9SPHN|nr:hypothetical protein [Sphingomonas oleivorans]PTQ13118.1 hypothetical protein CLG96_03025 [Sphingomonas oleivorans]
MSGFDPTDWIREAEANGAELTLAEDGNLAIDFAEEADPAPLMSQITGWPGRRQLIQQAIEARQD